MRARRRGPAGRSRIVSAASVSTWRDSGSSLSSQCRSIGKPALGGDARKAPATEAAPSAIVRSKCGMPPTTSTPRSSARFRFAAALGERK